MRKISPRWQFVIILAVLLFLWGFSSLWHSCNRAKLESNKEVQELYPIDVSIDSTVQQIVTDSQAVNRRHKTKSSFKSEKRGKRHTPVARDFLDEQIPNHR